MFRIGLTGGIAAGKSAASHRFAQLGIVVIDHDLLARQAVEPGSEGLTKIVTEFGPHMLTAAGELDRARLGRAVFGNRQLLEKLNAIIHPAVFALSVLAEEAVNTTDSNAIVVHDIPLLIETGQAHDFDELVVVMTPTPIRLERLVHGRGMDEKEAQRRIASQTTDDVRKKVATTILYGDGEISELNSQIDSLVEKIRLKNTKK